MMTLPKNWKPDENTSWYSISGYYKLSEEFIRKYKDKVYWYSISRDQELSEDFILEFKDEVHWYWISISQKHISHKFLNKYQYLLDFSWIDARRKYY